MPRVKKTCPLCCTEFFGYDYPSKPLRKPRQFCSKKCLYESGVTGRKTTIAKIPCKKCKKLFRPTNSKSLYCSRACYNSERPKLGLHHTFWRKVQKTETCWLWTGPKSDKGYGYAFHEGRTMSAHIASYMIHFGLVPEGLEIDHTCRVRNCVNPEHLEAVTHVVNLGRSPFMGGRNILCRHGHPFTEENTQVNRKGVRVCRICTRAAGKRSYQKNRDKVLAHQREVYKRSHTNSQDPEKSPSSASQSDKPRRR